jgi:cysteine desulfurase/selenocysteine lyase
MSKSDQRLSQQLQPWQLLAQASGVELAFVPIDDQGRLHLEVYAELLTHGPKLVAVTEVSNALGTINPVAEMIERAHAVGALVLLDGAQAVPHRPVDVGQLGVDFYVFSGHKALGPSGSGVLWGRLELLEAMPPFLGGGEMIREVSLTQASYAEVPAKFEAGTPDIAAVIGLGAALGYLAALDLARVREHEQALTAYALAALPRAVAGLTIHGPLEPAQRGGIVTFTITGTHPHDLASLLDREAVAIRAGHHCAMPLHTRLGLEASARASFGPYTTSDDIDRLVSALVRATHILRG